MIHNYIVNYHISSTVGVGWYLYVFLQVLKPISSLPSWAQAAFGTYRSLNRIQTRLADTALNSDENVLLCAPTVSPLHSHTVTFSFPYCPVLIPILPHSHSHTVTFSFPYCHIFIPILPGSHSQFTMMSYSNSSMISPMLTWPHTADPIPMLVRSHSNLYVMAGSLTGCR